MKPSGTYGKLRPEPDETIRVWSGTREGSETVGKYNVLYPNYGSSNSEWPGMKPRECMCKGLKVT